MLGAHEALSGSSPREKLYHNLDQVQFSPCDASGMASGDLGHLPGSSLLSNGQKVVLSSGPESASPSSLQLSSRVGTDV